MSLTCSDNLTISDIFRLLTVESNGNIGVNANLLDNATPYIDCSQAESNQDIFRKTIVNDGTVKINFIQL